MRPLTRIAVVALAALAPIPIALFACGGGVSASANDGGADADTDGDAMGFLVNEVGPGFDANVPHCKLDDGTDPVALCTQKIVLTALHARAFNAKLGLASSWSASTGHADVGDGGARLHVWTDDVGYAAASALYHTSAAVYGDPQLTPTLDSDLEALVPTIESELTPLPDEYSGEPYERLRVAAGGLRTVDHVPDGNAIDAIADAYGRAIYTAYFHLVPARVTDAGADGATGGAMDGGVDGASPMDAAIDARDAGAPRDASAPPADAIALPDATGPTHDASVAVPDGIFGRAGTGGIAYLSASAAAAAYAMVDLAVRHSGDPDHALWQAAAQAAFDHLYDRARDPATGLYYTALVTSSDPVHDALDASMPEPNVLLTDTTASVALALTRARDLVTANPSSAAALAAYPFAARIADALSSLNGNPSLYDGPANDASVSATGFLAGYATPTTLLTTKTTEGNAFALVVLYRQFFVTGTSWGTEIAPLTRTLINASPANASLFAVTPEQNAFFGACTRDFQLLSADAGGPYGDSYQSAATIAFVEAMNALLPPQ